MKTLRNTPKNKRLVIRINYGHVFGSTHWPPATFKINPLLHTQPNTSVHTQLGFGTAHVRWHSVLEHTESTWFNPHVAAIKNLLLRFFREWQ